MLSSWSKKRSIANRYNITSDSYDEQYAQEQTAKYQATQKVTLYLSHEVILDVGCGSGLFFSHIAHKVQTVIGVDISHKLLLKAKTNAKPFCNVHVVQADADHLPFKNTLFDVIFSFTMLQNMPTPKKTLLELKQQTKSDGKLVITGLKKAFKLTTFLDMLETNGLKLFEFIDDPNINCYIAIAMIPDQICKRPS
ncbi:MAG: class I SAM-dependent methyltransferase [Nitrososphaerota archaeon]|jgi:ubiquinone/menaquinone biosynthesis C-methylase UbiE|nr:class I SAM-dependent methyltransferase [Nitrososphaerota archaeon]